MQELPPAGSLCPHSGNATQPEAGLTDGERSSSTGASPTSGRRNLRQTDCNPYTRWWGCSRNDHGSATEAPGTLPLDPAVALHPLPIALGVSICGLGGKPTEALHTHTAWAGPIGRASASEVQPSDRHPHVSTVEPFPTSTYHPALAPSGKVRILALNTCSWTLQSAGQLQWMEGHQQVLA